MLQKMTRALAVAALAALPLAAAAEDLTIVSTVSGLKAPTTSTQYLSANKVRSSDGDSDTIMDLSTGTMTMIDHKKKEYWQTTADEMKAAFAQIEQQMQAMGPMLEKMMGGPAGAVTLTKGTAPKKIAGYDTEHWVVAMGQNMRYEIWAAPSLQLPINAAYYDAMKARYAALGPLAKRYEKIYEEMKKIKGFPLATITSISMMGKKQDMTSEATEVKKGAIPDSAFQVPAGYKKTAGPFEKMKKAS